MKPDFGLEHVAERAFAQCKQGTLQLRKQLTTRYSTQPAAFQRRWTFGMLAGLIRKAVGAAFEFFRYPVNACFCHLTAVFGKIVVDGNQYLPDAALLRHNEPVGMQFIVKPRIDLADRQPPGRDTLQHAVKQQFPVQGPAQALFVQAIDPKTLLSTR